MFGKSLERREIRLNPRSDGKRRKLISHDQNSESGCMGRFFNQSAFWYNQHGGGGDGGGGMHKVLRSGYSKRK